jgi:hypothetical protein
LAALELKAGEVRVEFVVEPLPPASASQIAKLLPFMASVNLANGEAAIFHSVFGAPFRTACQPVGKADPGEVLLKFSVKYCWPNPEKWLAINKINENSRALAAENGE